MTIRSLLLAALAALTACGEQTPTDPVSTTSSSDVAAQATSAASAEEIEAEATATFSPQYGVVIFSCRVDGGKQLRVVRVNGSVEYSYGSLEQAPELVLSGGKWAAVGYSGGSEAQIEFQNGDTSYVVFSRMVRTNFEPGEPNDPAISDGVIVLRDERVVSVKLCVGSDSLPISTTELEELIPREDELFTYETQRADP